MMKTTAFSLVLLAATLAAAASETKSSTLQPFTTINVCSPYNVVIGPSTGDQYQIMVEADTGVAESINATVQNNVLSLATNTKAPTALNFNAPNPIKVSVMLPADRLASVAISSTPSVTVAIAAGFAVPSFTASLGGTSTLVAASLKADQVELINAGTGSVYLGGTITSATVSSSGTGYTYLQGVTGTVAVDASGISKVYISGTAATQITGSISGISNIYYDQGQCNVQNQQFAGLGAGFGNIFGSPCTQGAIEVPDYLSTPQWSCNVTLYGTFGCSESGSSGTSSTSSPGGGGGTSSSSMSSGGGSGNTFSSETVNGVTTTSQSSSSPDGISQLVTNTGTLNIGSCPVTGAALDMLPSSS